MRYITSNIILQTFTKVMLGFFSGTGHHVSIKELRLGDHIIDVYCDSSLYPL